MSLLVYFLAISNLWIYSCNFDYDMNSRRIHFVIDSTSSDLGILIIKWSWILQCCAVRCEKGMANIFGSGCDNRSPKLCLLKITLKLELNDEICLNYQLAIEIFKKRHTSWEMGGAEKGLPAILRWLLNVFLT